MALKTIFADIVCLSKGRFNIAPSGFRFPGDINEGLLYFWMGRMNFRRLGPHGRFGIKNSGQRLILHLDKTEGFFSGMRICRGDRCNLFTYKTNAIFCQRILIGRVSRGLHEAVLYAGRILRSNHRFYPG